MYVPLDHWMICDRCGAKFRLSEMREEWTGLMVCKRGCWERRHPQDFVEGVEDIQTVEVARPDIANAMGQTTLSGDAAQWAITADLTSVSGLSTKDPIGVTLNNSVVHWTFINGTPVGSTVTLFESLPFAASSGNTVYLPSLDNETWT
jgi:hypothetical protein